MVCTGKGVANFPKIAQFLPVKCSLCMLCACCAQTPLDFGITGIARHPLREYVSAPGTRRAKFSHALVWPLKLGLRTPTLQCDHLSGPSRTRRGFFDFEVGGHDGADKGRVHVIVPFVGRKNGKLFDCQQSYNVLVLRVPGLEAGVMFGGKAL